MTITCCIIIVDDESSRATPIMTTGGNKIEVLKNNLSLVS